MNDIMFFCVCVYNYFVYILYIYFFYFFCHVFYIYLFDIMFFIIQIYVLWFVYYQLIFIIRSNFQVDKKKKKQETLQCGGGYIVYQITHYIYTISYHYNTHTQQQQQQLIIYKCYYQFNFFVSHESLIATINTLYTSLYSDVKKQHRFWTVIIQLWCSLYL